MKFIYSSDSVVKVAVTKKFYKEFNTTLLSYDKALDAYLNIDDDTNQNEKEKVIKQYILEKAKHNKNLKIYESLEKKAKNLPLLQKAEVQYGDSLKDGKFTNEFNKAHKIALGITNSLLLVLAVSTILIITSTTTFGLALIPASFIAIGLLAKKNISTKVKKHRKLEAKILEEQLNKEKKENKNLNEELHKLKNGENPHLADVDVSVQSENSVITNSIHLADVDVSVQSENSVITNSTHLVDVDVLVESENSATTDITYLVDNDDDDIKIRKLTDNPPVIIENMKLLNQRFSAKNNTSANSIKTDPKVKKKRRVENSSQSM